MSRLRTPSTPSTQARRSGIALNIPARNGMQFSLFYSVHFSGPVTIRRLRGGTGIPVDLPQNLLDAAHDASQRLGRHLVIRVVRDAAMFLRKVLRHTPQLRQLAAGTVQELFRVAALPARLDGPDVVEDHTRDLEHPHVVLYLVGVLQEGAYHPRMGEERVDTLHGFFGSHCPTPQSSLPHPIVMDRRRPGVDPRGENRLRCSLASRWCFAGKDSDAHRPHYRH